MKNAMQLKSVLKNMSKDKHVSAQLLLQNYMMERLLERISLSKYRDRFILKGGFLIAAMVGLDTRATMDLDATIKEYPVSEKTVKEMFEEVCKIDVNDGVSFAFRRIGEIREGDDYSGYRIFLTANYSPMEVPLKIDITTGDVITPKEIVFSYPLMIDERRISVLSYNPETLLSEKLETVITRSDQNTRMRDYYDIYILNKLWMDKIQLANLKKALLATSKKRGSYNILKDYSSIMKVVTDSEVMQSQWRKYQKDYTYASEVDFKDTCMIVSSIMDRIWEL